MGLFKSLWQLIVPGKKTVRILCVGLDNSGKTSIISHIKPRKAAVEADIVPTVGFNVEEFTKNGF